MRTASFKTLRDSVLRRMGLDAAQPVLGSQAAAIADYIEAGLSDVWGLYDWPDTTLLGKRPHHITAAFGISLDTAERLLKEERRRRNF